VDLFIDLGMYISMDYVGWMQGRSLEVHPAGVRKEGGGGNGLTSHPLLG
jgi:hypothetical protein